MKLPAPRDIKTLTREQLEALVGACSRLNAELLVENQALLDVLVLVEGDVRWQPKSPTLKVLRAAIAGKYRDRIRIRTPC